MALVEPATRTFALRPFLTATKDFAAGADTPRAYLERCIAAIAAHEPAVGAFVETNLGGARTAADQATERRRAGKPRSAIDGMPVGVKDIIETYDMPTQMGSPLFDGWRGERDAAAVYALRAAGAVIVGKTVTTEFAATHPRGTRNPHDPRRTPGGSSSGSAAAVATGMVPAALGTQVVSFEEKPTAEGGLINGGFFILEPSVLELIDGYDTVWEKEPMESLAAEGQLAAWVHRGFWQPMDTLRDKQNLNSLWDGGAAPWKLWE